MRPRQTLPSLWLLTDKRTDAGLEAALKRLPRGSGVVFRHYHLSADDRRERFVVVARIARRRGHFVVLAGPAALARAWGADGNYGASAGMRGMGTLLRLATAHSLRELGAAAMSGADAVFLSPVFATRSHPGATTLGPVRFRLLARPSSVPVIALGGLNTRAARVLRWPRWGAIDGLSRR